MRRNMLMALGAVVILAGLAGGYRYWEWRNSPRYALQQMVLALKNRDVEQLFTYIDFPSVIGNFGQEASEDLGGLLPEKPQADELERFGRRLLEKFMRTVSPKLVEALMPQIKAGAQTFLENLTTTQVMALGAAVTMAEIETRGETAIVTLRDPKTKEPFRFSMHKDPKEGKWQISGVRYQDFKKFLRQEFQ